MHWTGHGPESAARDVEVHASCVALWVGLEAVLKMRQATILLPPLEVLRGSGAHPGIERILRCANPVAGTQEGLRAQQLRWFEVVPKPAPWASITREFDCGDAADWLWLRADPVSLRVEAGGLRLMASGSTLELSQADSDALAATMRPLLHDLGMLFSAPNPRRWYVQLARGRPLPAFVDPEIALGTLATPLPADAARAQEWMRLLNEAQMALHEHPVNRGRVASGKLPVNSVWLWGAGEAPVKVEARFTALLGEDEELRALAFAARIPLVDRVEFDLNEKVGHLLYDARRATSRKTIDLALQAHYEGRIALLRLDSEDGTVVEHRRWHRFRFWR